MKPILSVIIPIYKVESYLERCVNSVLNQDYRNIEVILVDDGSPDRCPEICDAFANKDERVRVIHKPNGGSSSARNAGINMATGEYIAFLDSDDQWANGKLRFLMEYILRDNPNMTVFLSYDLLPNGKLARRNNLDFFRSEWYQLNRNEYYEILIESGDLHESACSKIINLEFLKNNNLYFKEGITAEDTEWMFRILRCIETISISNIPLFICTNGRTGSITNSISIRNINDLINIIISSVDYYEHKNESTKTYELAQCSYLWSTCLSFASSLKGDDYRRVALKLKEVKTMLDLKSHPKSKKVDKVYGLLGYDVTSFILRIYLYLHKKNILNKKLLVD